MEIGFEFEEPEAVEASHLLRARCVKCGAEALAVEEHVRDALCQECRGGSVVGELGAYAPVVGYPRGERPARGEERAMHPAPAMRSHLCPMFGHVLPVVVERIAGTARGAGWRVSVSHARGRGIHGSTGRPTGMRESWVVRFWGAREERAVAVYSSPGGWGDMWIWGPSRPWWSCPTLADLQWWLTQVIDPDWYAGVMVRVAEQALAKEEHAACVKIMRELGVAESVRLFGLELEIPEVYALTAIKAKKAREGSS